MPFPRPHTCPSESIILSTLFLKQPTNSFFPEAMPSLKSGRMNCGTECLSPMFYCALYCQEVLKALDPSQRLWQKPICSFRDNTCVALSRWSIPEMDQGILPITGRPSPGHPPFLMSLSTLLPSFPLPTFQVRLPEVSAVVCVFTEISVKSGHFQPPVCTQVTNDELLGYELCFSLFSAILY